MRIDRRLVGLGLFLVTAGAVMLAVRQGLIPDAVAQRAWTLWPLILVGSGLSIVLAGRPGASLGGLVVALTFGAMLGGIAATGWSGGFGFLQLTLHPTSYDWKFMPADGQPYFPDQGTGTCH